MRKNISKLQIFRRISQVVFFFLFSGLFTLTFAELKQVYQMLLNGNFNFFEALPRLVEAIALVPLTVFFGRFFCAWSCAFGALNDFIFMISKNIFKTKYEVNARVNSVLKYLKYVILTLIVYFIWTKGSHLFDTATPWGAFAQLPQLSDAISQYALGSLILGLIMLGAAFIERFFCRYLCPLGAIFAILSRLRILRIVKPTQDCGTCRICTSDCPMGIDLYKAERVDSGECINCLRCTSTCPRKNTQISLVGEKLNPTFASIIALAAFTWLYSEANVLGSTVAANATKAAISSKAPSSTPHPGKTNRDNASTGNNNPANSLPADNSGANNSHPTGPQYKDGTYTGVGRGHRPGLEVAVTIKNNKISDIEITSSYETPRYARYPFSVIPDEIIQAQSTNVDVVSGATQSSDGIIEAVQDALSQA